MTYHVLPVNDLKEHAENTTCECHPKVIFENGNMVVVHNSYDGREGLELYNELINESSSNNDNL
jgi:hypothetical protein